MARRPRLVIDGLSHHVYQRGHNGKSVFACDRDRQRFLWQTREAMADFGIAVHGFSLMTNHYHFVVTPPDKRSLSDAMSSLLSQYTMSFNRAHGRSGTLWNGRFNAKPIEDERYWLNCLRYVEANPVEAGIVASPGEYRWTSYRIHAAGEPSAWLRFHDVYLSLGKDPAERQAAYRALWQSDPIPDWFID